MRPRTVEDSRCTSVGDQGQWRSGGVPLRETNDNWREEVYLCGDQRQWMTGGVPLRMITVSREQEVNLGVRPRTVEDRR